MLLSRIVYILRSFKKDRTFFTINIFGLTVGIVVALLAGFYVLHQTSYEKFVKDYKHIYRLEYIVTEQGNRWHKATASPSLARVMQAEIPGIKEVMVQHYTGLNIQFQCDDIQVNMDNWMMATKNYLEYYGAQCLKGSLDNFNTSQGLVITESFAKKYFKDSDPIGKELRIPQNNFTRFVIEAVIKDLPLNTHVKVNAIATNQSEWSNKDRLDDYEPDNLIWGFQYVYLILEENVKIQDVLDKYSIVKEKYLQKSLDDRGIDIEIDATPLTKIHFTNGLLGDRPTENINSIYFFLIIASVVIILSIINFINLSLARQREQFKDIAIRKTFGASKSSIFIQSILETSFFLLFCFSAGFVVFKLLLPSFAQFNNIFLSGVKFQYYWYWIIVPFFILLTSLSGLYPAFAMSRKNTIELLKNNSGKTKKFTRQVFVAVQIILSITFLFITLVIYKQMSFIENADKGYNLEDVVVYEYYNFGDNMPSCDEICGRLEESAYIEETAVSTKLPGQEISRTIIDVNLSSRVVDIEAYLYNIDEDYLPFMSIDLVEGRNFDRNLGSDSSKVIVNEAFVRSVGAPENIIGSRVYLNDNLDEYGIGLDSEIIGVVKDYHMQTLHQKISPLVLTHIPFAPNYYHIKYRKENALEIIKHANNVFDDLAKQNILTATQHFPEEEIIRQYKAEKNLSITTIWLSVLSVILAVLGVFGLTAFMIRYSMKSLAMRKVLGANFLDLLKYLIHDYIIILGISNLVALPLAWHISNIWLQQFAYQISIPVTFFILVLVTSALIVIIAILYHVWIVDKVDPVNYLQED